MLNEALKLARRGIAVFVLAPGSKKPPAGTHGVKEWLKDENEIKKKWLQHPRANVGVALGEVSGLVAIDVDRNHGATDADLARFPRTVTVRTRNGFHLYYKYPPGGVKSHSVIKLDGKSGDAAYLRSNGLYVVGPSSIVSWHENEPLTPWEYQWHSDAGGELSFDECDVAELPDWCLGKPVHSDAVRPDSLRLGRGPENASPASQPEANPGGTGTSSKAMYGPNERHAYFVKAAAAMRKEGKSKEAIIRQLHKINERDCNPPKPPGIAVPEIEKIADYYAKNCQVIDYEEGPANGPMNHAPVTAIPATTDQACVDTAGDGGVVDVPAAAEVLPAVKEPKLARPKPNGYLLAHEFLYQMGYTQGDVVKLRYHLQDFLLFNGKCYEVWDDEGLREEINRWLADTGRDGLAGTRIVSVIIDNIKTKPRFIDTKLRLPVIVEGLVAREVNHTFLPLKNGLFDMETWARTDEGKLIEHTPNYVCTYALPFDYDPKATCPTYERVLHAALTEQAVRDLWEEIMGIHLFPSLGLEYFFMLQGEGANGKSTLTAVLRCLLGEQNVSSVTLEAFKPGDKTFIETYGKLANIISEQFDIDNINEGTLRNYVSREPITFDRKFKNAVTGKPTGYLTMCVNAMPRFQDKTDATWRRLVGIPFMNQVPKDQQDGRLKDPAFWNESGELPGIFNRALAGLRRVLSRDPYKLEIPESCQIFMKKYRDDLNPVAQFIEDHLTLGVGKVQSKAVYQEYRKFCAAEGYNKPLGKITFTKQLESTLKRAGANAELSKVNVWFGGDTGRVWSGLGIRANVDPYLAGQNEPESPKF